MRKFIDSLQIWLYLTGFTTLARLVGKLGTEARPVRMLVQGADVVQDDDDIHERITVPAPDPSRAGPGWSLDEVEAGPLKIIDFDPTFNRNKGIDASRDVAFPNTKLDVN